MSVRSLRLLGLFLVVIGLLVIAAALIGWEDRGSLGRVLLLALGVLIAGVGLIPIRFRPPPTLQIRAEPSGLIVTPEGGAPTGISWPLVDGVRLARLGPLGGLLSAHVPAPDTIPAGLREHARATGGGTATLIFRVTGAQLVELSAALPAVAGERYLR